MYLKSILLLMMCRISLIDTFFSENILCIIGFDSHDDHRKIRMKLENFEKNFEFLGDALFENDDEITTLKH